MSLISLKNFRWCTSFEKLLPHPGASVQPVLHDANELLVRELVIVIHVKDLEDSVDQVACQLETCGHIYCSRKLIWQGTKTNIVYLTEKGDHMCR